MNAARSIGALVALALLVFALTRCGGETAPATETPKAATTQAAADELAADARLAYLLGGCAKAEHYDVDTSDALPILLETLQHGYRDPLRRAREELGAGSHEAIVAVARLVDANLQAQDAGPFMRNAIDVLQRTDDPAAHDPLVRLLTFREQSVAILAAEALRKHGKPEDFDLVLALFEIAAFELRGKLIGTLHALDMPRAERLFLDWLEHDAEADLWDLIAPKLAAATDASVVERCCKLWPKLGPEHQYSLAAACARAGDERALTLLREALVSSNPAVRSLALDSLATARMPHEFARVVTDDPDPDMRLRALSHLAASPRVAEFAGELRTALGDASENVRLAAAFQLAKRGDSAAIEKCVAALDDGATEQLSSALAALREAMHADAALAERVLARLVARRDTEAKLPAAARAAVLAAIGQVPLEDAAALLYAQSLVEEGTIAELRAGRWLVLQAGNTGEVGARYLAARFAAERDPERRLDLMEGIAMRGEQFARDFLAEQVDGGELAPLELLYAAERLTRMGPVEFVAPLLKRATLRVTEPTVRVALQCLLWSNYPGPR